MQPSPHLTGRLWWVSPLPTHHSQIVATFCVWLWWVGGSRNLLFRVPEQIPSTHHSHVVWRCSFDSGSIYTSTHFSRYAIQFQFFMANRTCKNLTKITKTCQFLTSYVQHTVKINFDTHGTEIIIRGILISIFGRAVVLGCKCC